MNSILGCLALLGLIAVALALDAAICYGLALLVHAAFHNILVSQAFVVLVVLSFVLTWVGASSSRIA